MKSRLNVLVLGVGGNVSQGILKALAQSKVSCRVVGACVSPLSFGLYTVDKAYVSPMAADENFIDWVVEVCYKERVDVIFSGVEPILNVLAVYREEIKKLTGAICIVSDSGNLEIGGDKFKTCQWLKENGMNFPRYALAKDVDSVEDLLNTCGYPLFAKPRFGRGGKGIMEIRNRSDIEYVHSLPDYIIQEYLGNEQSEYTVGGFCDKHGVVCGTIILRRDLLEGTTYRAEVVDLPEIREEAERIVSTLKPYGPCNMQFRLVDGRPVCFEINVRFSGTTPMRARFGFNDVEVALRHFVLGEEIEPLPLIREGIALRYWNEIYISPAIVQRLEDLEQMEQPKHSVLVEDYGLL